MKKIIFNVIIILIMFVSPLFAEETIEFNIDLNSTESLNVGFSSSPVFDFKSVDELNEDQHLVFADAYSGELVHDSVYVFWQIQSSKKYEISLNASPMQSADGDILNVRLSTAIPSYNIMDSENLNIIDTGGEGKSFDMSSSSQPSGGILYSYSGKENNQAVGSQEVMLETESFEERKPDTYVGKLTLTITEIGD